MALLPQAGMAADAADAMGAARERLVQEVQIWVAEQAGVAAVQVDIPALDSRLRVAVCSSAIRLDFPFPARNLVRARCEAPPWQVFIPVAIRPLRHVLVASRDLAVGQTLTDADMVARQAAGGDGLEERSAAIGRVLKRALAQGSLILAQDLEVETKVVRLKVPLKAGATLTAHDYQIEALPGALAPAGAAPAIAPGEGSRIVADLSAGHILMAADLAVGRRVLVARQNLAAGQALESSMLVPGLVYSRDPKQQYFVEFAGLEHAELVRSIQSGEPVRALDVRPATLVRRGQLVLLTVSTAGGLQVSLRVEALQDGKLGDPVKMKNPESGRLMSGVVTGRNAARGL